MDTFVSPQIWIQLYPAEVKVFMYFESMKLYPHLAEAIANTVEYLRKERKMSKSSLADYADIERCYLRGIERGERRPTVNTIFCICDALQTDPVEFFRLVMAELERLERPGM